MAYASEMWRPIAARTGSFILSTAPCMEEFTIHVASRTRIRRSMDASARQFAGKGRNAEMMDVGAAAANALKAWFAEDRAHA